MPGRRSEDFASAPAKIAAASLLTHRGRGAAPPKRNAAGTTRRRFRQPINGWRLVPAVAIPVMTVPAAPVMRVMPALPAVAVPEAAGFRRLRRRNADQQGHSGQSAKDVLHGVIS